MDFWATNVWFSVIQYLECLKFCILVFVPRLVPYNFFHIIFILYYISIKYEWFWVFGLGRVQTLPGPGRPGLIPCHFLRTRGRLWSNIFPGSTRLKARCLDIQCSECSKFGILVFVPRLVFTFARVKCLKTILLPFSKSV